MVALAPNPLAVGTPPMREITADPPDPTCYHLFNHLVLIPFPLARVRASASPRGRQSGDGSVCRKRNGALFRQHRDIRQGIGCRQFGRRHLFAATAVRQDFMETITQFFHGAGKFGGGDVGCPQQICRIDFGQE